MISLGQKLYAIRLEKGPTQQELVLRSGVSQSNLSNIENGRRDFTVSTLFKMCYALDVPPAHLFEMTPQAPITKFITRERIERLARAVWGDPCPLNNEEQETVGLLRHVVPVMKGRISQKKIYSAWSRLRTKFTAGEIRILTERVRGEGNRRHAKKSD